MRCSACDKWLRSQPALKQRVLQENGGAQGLAVLFAICKERVGGGVATGRMEHGPAVLDGEHGVAETGAHGSLHSRTCYCEGRA